MAENELYKSSFMWQRKNGVWLQKKWNWYLPGTWRRIFGKYQKTNPAYDAYRKANNKDRYRADHERAIILHEATAKTLQTTGITKLPNLTSLQAEYEQLQAQKEALYADYGKLKKQVKEYDVIKRNIDSILRQDKEPEREKGTEHG